MGAREVKTVGQSLEDLLQHLGLDKKIKGCRVVELWPQIVGEKISQVTHAERVTDRTLHVRVKGMAWRTELLFQKPTILKRIEQVVGQDVVKEIRFF